MRTLHGSNEDFKIDSTNQNFDFRKFLKKYGKYWPLVFISIILSIGIGYFINRTTPPIYQVSGKFYIKEDNSNQSILNLTGLQTINPKAQGNLLSNEAIFLKSKPIAEKVLETLDLNVEYYLPGNFIDIELYKDSPIFMQVDWNHTQITGDKMIVKWLNKETFTIYFPDSEYYKVNPSNGFKEEIDLGNFSSDIFSFGEWVELPFARFKLDLLENSSQGEIFVKVRTKESLVAQYTGDDLVIWPLDKLSSILGLTLNTSHPQKGADYLNALMEVYLQRELDDKNRIAKSTVDFIDNQISGVSDSLNLIETNLQSYRTANKTYNIDTESNTVFKEITDLEKELSQEKLKKQYFTNLQFYLERESYDQIIVPSGLGIQDPILNMMVQNLITYQNDRSNLLATQTEASPRVKEVSRKIQDVNASLSEAIRNLSRNNVSTIEDLESRIRSIEKQFTRLPSTEQNLIKIRREFTLNETIYTFLLQRRAEAAISMASTTAANRIVEYSQPNYKAITIKKYINLLFSLVAGTLLPIFVIVIFVTYDKRIKDIKELEDNLISPLIGKIVRANKKSNLAVLTEPRSAISESFRSLKTNISFVIPKDNQLTIAVSSTLSGEGKTFTALNLASIYSLSEKKVVLISCDMFKPDGFTDLSLGSKKGLSNYLSRQLDSFFDIIQKTKFSNFDIIIAGSIPPNPSELLGSERFSELLNELKKIYDVIILDTPPVGLVSQSYEVVKMVDIFLYVLRFNYSQNSFVAELNSIKSTKGLKNLYTVINDLPEKEITYKGYGHVYYDTDKRKKSIFKKLFQRNKAAF